MPFDTRHCQVIRGRETLDHDESESARKVTRPLVEHGQSDAGVLDAQASTTPYEAKAKFVLRLSPRPDTGRIGTGKFAVRAIDFCGRRSICRRRIPAVRQVDAARARGCADRLRTPAMDFRVSAPTSIRATREQQSDDAKVALTTKHGSPKGRARAMVTLCRALGFPARLVTGFIIRQGANIQPHVWVEVFQNQEWVPFDPTNGYSLNLPMNYVPVRRDADDCHEHAERCRSGRPAIRSNDCRPIRV